MNEETSIQILMIYMIYKCKKTISLHQADFSEAEDVTEKKIVRHIFKVKPSKHLKGRYEAVCSSSFLTRNGKGKNRKKPGGCARDFQV